MPVSSSTTWFVTHPTVRDIEHAARIWAAATAQRDGLHTPAGWEEKVTGVKARLALPHSVLIFTGIHLGLDSFALLAQGDDHDALDLFYLTSVPAVWGKGRASSLLESVEGHARSQGVSHLWLWVIEDNDRAKKLYERSGWEPTEQLHVQGRAERLYRRSLM